MSVLINAVKLIVKKSDLFASMQFLRFKTEAETKTYTGGFVSLSIVIFLATQFTTMILDTLGKVKISSVTDSTQASQPPQIYYSTHQNGKRFMLGFELWGYDLNTGPRYFDISVVNAVLIQGLYSNQTIDIPMQPCTKEHWAGLPDIDVLYDRVGMSTWLCMPVNQTYIVSGNYVSEMQRSIDITVSRCNNATDPSRPCATPQQIDAFMRSDSQFYWTPYFMNPLINPQNKQYLTYYLEDKWYVMSGFNYGSQMYIYSDDFQITTDESILPFSSEHHDTGPIVSSIFANAYDLDNTSDIYCLINFFRAPNSIIIQREFEKVLDAFAYVGGLLGSFILILILVTFYNEGSYQLNFASALYLPEEGSPTTFRKYNLFYYIIQGIYGAFRLFGYKLSSWKCTEFFYETRKEMLKQLDVMFLFRKIYILESAIQLLLTKSQFQGLMLQHQLNVTQARKIRKKYGIKLDVAKLAKHKLNNPKQDEFDGGGSNQKAISMAKMGISDLEVTDNHPKDVSFQDKPTMLRRFDQSAGKKKMKVEDNEQINLSDYGSDSESSGAEEEHLEKQEQLLQDLYQLQEDCMQNNEISMKIYDNMDPRIKRLLQKVTHIKFENSMKLSKMRKKSIPKEFLELEYNEDGNVDLESPILRKVHVGSPDAKKRKSTKNLSNQIQLLPQQSKFDGQKLDFDFNSLQP